MKPWCWSTLQRCITDKNMVGNTRSASGAPRAFSPLVIGEKMPLLHMATTGTLSARGLHCLLFFSTTFFDKLLVKQHRCPGILLRVVGALLDMYPKMMPRQIFEFAALPAHPTKAGKICDVADLPCWVVDA
uniref:Uncharacterized protein n=1 Tax=Heterosigma akashiwo TaxID=2829 RepID=A0A6V1TIK3_HETAK|mmetsp:Transcript_28988/g.50317  ORF Transcript_28988/g.50317 Transcript_28988/m.50317 type:complete len:131 (+) Transcript_28988:669-1061(+)